ncbi:DUF4159 domain-containing protein [Rhodospirillales bacterium]|nr:DUF4159 domain-containing protein [Rhodospirillales bacterium]
MVSLGPLAFLTPWALAALIALPAIWWLLRLTPPIPNKVVFPPIQLLFGLISKNETASKTPWWLLLLRLLIAALIIFAAARPLLHAETELGSDGPVLIVIDNGWAAAERWDVRRDIAVSIADRAARADRQIVILPTAAPSDGGAIAVQSLGAEGARDVLSKLLPQPWPSDRGDATTALTKWAESFNGLADIRWLSDGIDDAGADVLGERLKSLGRLTIYGSNELQTMVVRPPEITPAGLELTVERARADAVNIPFEVRGLDGKGRVQAVVSGQFEQGARTVDLVLDAPSEILNRIDRVQIGNAMHAGAVVLLDQRWRRRAVGIVDVDGAAEVQPLLSKSYYISRALEKTAGVTIASFNDLLATPLSVLIAPDGFAPTANEIERLQSWISDGGVVVRFAGPALARQSAEGNSSDTLLPVELRSGNRVIGGAMSWSQPMRLAPFPASSPFAGLTPPVDARVRRQVLAQPTPDLAEKTWAALEDGTPLVTADKRGRGWVVLIHTAPTTVWSDLPISGIFVEMMQRLSALGQGVAIKSDASPLTPEMTLDAFGRLGAPPAGAQPILASAIDDQRVSQQNPPGIYGNADIRRAFNLTALLPTLEPLPLPDGAVVGSYEKPTERELTAWLYMLALGLFLIDMVVGLWVRTGARATSAVTGLLMVGFVASMGWGGPVKADEKFALENSIETRLAFVQTGDTRIDQVSELGLTGLTVMLARRTAAELGAPQAVELGRDELAFFPMIYWPVTPGLELDDVARLAVVEYLRNGGTILFDTQERGGTAQASAMRELAADLSLPPLVPVSSDHVLTRAFYLLEEFPGRFAGGTLWVERAGERVNDGVSPVMAGSSDWASAWALDENYRPIFPVVPGGERQREMAFRFGINLVMHVLTGNYKADQVHMPAIIKRLGQ